MVSCLDNRHDCKDHPPATIYSQLDHALFAALHTSGSVATYWVEESKRQSGLRVGLLAPGGMRPAIAKNPEPKVKVP